MHRQVTLTVSMAILVSNFGTTILSPGLQDIASDFGVGAEVGILGISLYLVGFGTLIFGFHFPDFSYWPAICGSTVRGIRTEQIIHPLYGNFHDPTNRRRPCSEYRGVSGSSTSFRNRLLASCDSRRRHHYRCIFSLVESPY